MASKNTLINKPFNKTFMLLTPQEITQEDFDDYIDSDIFKQILTNNKWKIIKYDNTLNFKKLSKTGIGFIYSTGTATYDKSLFEVPVFIKNLFEVKSHRLFTNKYDIYIKLKSVIGSRITEFMAESWHINNLQEVQPDCIYIARPIEGFKGIGIKLITNNGEYQKLKKEHNIIQYNIVHNRTSYFNTKIYERGIMISRYFLNPLLFNEKKFHLRTYLMIKKFWNNNINNYEWSWSFFERAKILTASENYKNSDWENKKIHDTHISSTDDDYYYPEDLKLNDKLINHINDQLLFICDNIFNIIKNSNINTFSEVVNSFEVLGPDFMILDDYSVKLIEVNNKLGYGVIHKESDKVKKYTFDFFNWIYINGLKQSEKELA